MASPKKTEKASFQLSPLALQRLDKLAAELGISRAEVVRRSLGIYNWLVEELNADKDVLLRDSRGETQAVVWDPSLHLRGDKTE